MDKLTKVKAEIERLKEIAEYNLSHSKMDRSAWMQQAACCTKFLSFIDSMQKEPKECMYSKDNYTDEDRKVLCEGCEEECEFNKKEEPVSEDLEEVSYRFACKCHPLKTEYSITSPNPEVIEAFKDGANWQKQKDESYTKSMYKVGINTGKELMKQQLLAKAVDATVHIDAGGYPYIPQMELYDYDKDIPLAKEGDKYKVILIKEY